MFSKHCGDQGSSSHTDSLSSSIHRLYTFSAAWQRDGLTLTIFELSPFLVGWTEPATVTPVQAVAVCGFYLFGLSIANKLCQKQRQLHATM